MDLLILGCFSLARIIVIVQRFIFMKVIRKRMKLGHFACVQISTKEDRNMIAFTGAFFFPTFSLAAFNFQANL